MPSWTSKMTLFKVTYIQVVKGRKDACFDWIDVTVRPPAATASFFTMLKHQTALFITTKLASSHLTACEIKSQFYISDQFYPMRDYKTSIINFLWLNKIVCIQSYYLLELHP